MPCLPLILERPRFFNLNLRILQEIMEQIAYEPIDPPFTLRFWEMSKKELKDYDRWFHDVMPERINELANAVKSSPGFEGWKPDYTPTSLNALGGWFATQVDTRPRAQDEIGEMAAKSVVSKSDWDLTNRTISLAMDIAMYLSQVLLRNHPSLRWDQQFGSKKYVDYGQPVLAGFPDDIPMNPVRVITSLAYGLAKKTSTAKRLREIYDSVQQGVRKA